MVTPAQLKRRAELYHQLGSTLAAGVPLIKALQMASTHQALRASKKTIERLMAYLQQGHTLRDAIYLVETTKEDRQPGMEVSLTSRSGKFKIPDFDLAMMGVGEETGRLDLIFKQLGQHYEAKAQIYQETITGLIKPMLTLHVFLLVFPLSLLILFARGIMDGDYHLCIPFIVEKIAVFGFMYGTIFLIIFACQGTRNEWLRAFIESISQCIPMLRTALKNMVLARFTSSLECLVNAGVPVVRSWEMAARTCGSAHLKRQVEAWSPQLETGMTPADMVKQIRYFPEMFTDLYSTAEMTGSIDQTLVRLRDYYQEEGFRMLRMSTRTMNGIIYGAIMITAAINIMSFWIHYYGGMVKQIQDS